MPSDIDATKPEQGSATTISVRENFAAAKAEIVALQDSDTTINGRIDNRAERAGDLGGTGTSSTVVAIQGRAVTAATPAPVAGQPLTWNATPAPGAWTPQNVAQLQGVAVSAIAPSVGQVLTYQATPSPSWVPTTAGAGLADAPNDGVAYGRENASWQPVRRVYRCNGTTDALNIRTMVQNFFAGTLMAMELVITGTLEWPVTFDFNFTNGRSAVLTIDFTDCHIPDTEFDPSGDPFIHFRGGVSIVIRGLRVNLDYDDWGDLTELFVIRNDSTGRITLDHCYIQTSSGPTNHLVVNTRSLTISNSYIMGSSGGAPPYCVENRTTNAYLHVSNSYLQGSSSGGGYALLNDAGTAMVASSRLNAASGGTAYALHNSAAGNVMISSCHLSTGGNAAYAIYNDSARLSMAGCFVAATQSGGGLAMLFTGTGTAVISASQSIGTTRSGVQVSGSARVAFSDCQISGTASPQIDAVAAYTGTLKLMNCRLVTGSTTNLQASVTGTANIIVHGCEFGSALNDINNNSTNTNLYWNVVGNLFSRTQVTLHNAAITDSTTATRYMPTNANRFGQTITA